MARRRTLAAETFARKLRRLRLLSPKDHQAIQLLVDDVLKYRLAHIEDTAYWKGPAKRIGRASVLLLSLWL